MLYQLPPLKSFLEEFRLRGLIPFFWQNEEYDLHVNNPALPRSYEGLCSSFLCRRSPSSICGRFVDSVFTLPETFERPIVFVACGSGVGPLRAIWRELLFREQEGHKIGPAALFFGCRYSEKNWIYRDEMLKLAGVKDEDEERTSDGSESSLTSADDNDEKRDQKCRRRLDIILKEKDGVENNVSDCGALPKFFSLYGWAFSRNQKEKRYIDIALKEHANDIWDLMNKRRGIMYMCGSSGFQKTAFTALNQIGKDKTGDPNIVEKWIQNGQLVDEVFG